MNKGLLIRIVICIFIFGICLFNYIDKVNKLTKLKLNLPKIEKEIILLKEENKRVRYEIDQFENPMHLMELARSPAFSHLKHPLIKDVLKLQEGIALKENKVEKSRYNVNNDS